MQAKDYFAVVMFIEYGVEINSRFESIGEYLTHNLLRIGTGKTVLELAIEFDEVSLVEYFLSNKADPTNTRQFYEVVQGSNFKTNYITTAVYDAILHDRLDILTLFVQSGADLNKMCYERQDYKSFKPNLTQTPLQAAIAHGRKDIVALLLSAGIEL
jgi:ankyrin repeat protein